MEFQVPRVSAAEAVRPLFLGVDVGGTNVKLGLLDDRGATIAYRKVPTYEERGPAEAVERIATLCREMLAEHDLALTEVAAVGLGTPGSMDIPRGLILEPPNMPHWRDFPIRDRLSEVLGVPAAFANDANAAAYGEFWIGRGRDYPSLVMLTLGTGVGGGIIVDGHSVDGTNSFGSECGYIVVDPHDDARFCVWGGGQGQLEAYACAPAVVARFQEAIDAGRESSVVAKLDAGEALTPLLISQEAERGDPLSLEIIFETARYLGIAIATLAHLIDPGLVVIGGAMTFGQHETKVGRQFLEAVRVEFLRRAFNVVAEGTRIDFAQLGGAAGYIGAAGLAQAAYHQGAWPQDRSSG